MSASTELATQPRKEQQSAIIELSKQSIEDIRNVPTVLNEFYKNILQKDTDYGQVPGTPKPSLWKPGAELLQMAAKLHSESHIIAQIEPDGKGVFFSYTIECRLYNQFGDYVGNGFGSCNSKETRYAFRWLYENQISEGEDKSKHKTRIIETKDYRKVTQWRFDTTEDEIYTLQNTIIKMAKKRAFIDAILSVTSACYSSDTEVMTGKGWKLFSDLSKWDEVATRRDDGIIEFHVPIERHVYDFSGNMIAFGGTFRSRVDLLVTPNHNMLVKDWNQQISLKSASVLLEEVRTRKGFDIHQSIVRTSIWTGQDMEYFTVPALPGYQKVSQNQVLYQKAVALRSSNSSMSMLAIGRELGVKDGTIFQWLTGRRNPTGRIKEVAPRRIPINLFLEFLGWYLSEGNCREDAVEISQTKASNIPKIKELGKAMGYGVAYCGHGIRFYSKQLMEYCKQFGHCDQKFIPQEIKQLPSYRLQILLDALLAGDGTVSIRKGGLRYAKYTTTSRQLADDVQEIAIKACYSSVICRSKREFSGHVMGRLVIKFRDIYDVTIVKQRDTLINRSAVREVPYNGKVFCVTVPNHTLLVRRNGKYAWCGNSRIFTQDVEDDAYSSVEDSEPPKNVTPQKIEPPPEAGKKVVGHSEAKEAKNVTPAKTATQSKQTDQDVSKLISSLRWVMNKNEPDREFAFASQPIGHIKDEVKPLLSAIESAKGKLVLLEEDGMNFAYTYDAKSERFYRQPVSALDASAVQ